MQTGETANLSVLDDHEVVYLARSNSPRIVSIGFQTGARVPAHVVAPGFVLLASLPPPKFEEWMDTLEFSRYTAQTITDPDSLRASVSAARNQGYWLANQYLDTGLCGLAVALTDRKGHGEGAISMTFQAHLYPGDAALVKLLPALRDVAAVIRGVI